MTTESRRSEEALAQSLYEASDPTGVPWVRRAPTVRDPWLRLARKHLSGAGENPR